MVCYQDTYGIAGCHLSLRLLSVEEISGGAVSGHVWFLCRNDVGDISDTTRDKGHSSVCCRNPATGHLLCNGIQHVVCILVSLPRESMEQGEATFRGYYVFGWNDSGGICKSGTCQTGYQNVIEETDIEGAVNQVPSFLYIAVTEKYRAGSSAAD